MTADSPRPVPTGDAAPKDFLPAMRFNFLTPVFDLVVRTTMRETRFKRELLDHAAIEPDHRVLDLGCGTGTLALRAKERAPEAEIVGLDGDPKILDLARSKSEAAGIEVSFDHAYSTELPYDSGSFDRVLSTLFFHHLSTDDKRTTLAEIARVLKLGGELHIADFTKASDPLMAIVFSLWRPFDGLERTRVNARGELGAMISAAGFQAVTEHTRLRTGIGTLGLLSAARES
jgi:cyclopropane fatty-acyl-phospholipid synthase-like methyltransferase